MTLFSLISACALANNLGHDWLYGLVFALPLFIVSKLTQWFFAND